MNSEFRRVLLGRGVLTWDGEERRSDRYGTVSLRRAPDSDYAAGFDLGELNGLVGSLVAIVLETRPSPHIGDLFRGFRTSTPDVGETIMLGNGSLFVEGQANIGLKPVDGREADWLNPEALYRAHHQTVELVFVEGNPEDLMWG